MSEIAPVAHVTPYGGEHGGTLNPGPHEMVIISERNGVLTVRDPLIGEYRIGDGSFYTNPVVDGYISCAWDITGMHVSTRQLNDTELRETIVGTGRFSRGQHMAGSAAVAQSVGGTPEEVMEMATHDDQHRKDSHGAEDLLDGRGDELGHERNLLGFMRDMGFLDRLRAAGLIDNRGRFIDTNLTVHDVLSLENIPGRYTNWSAETRYLKAEALQYVLFEAIIWQMPVEKAREILSHIKLVRAAQHISGKDLGDQLVFDATGERSSTGIAAAEAYVRAESLCIARHWADPANSIIDALKIPLDKAVLLDGRDHSERTRYHPADILYVDQESWQDTVRELSETNPFISLLDTIAITLAKDQRAANMRNGTTNFSAPDLPSWIELPKRTYDLDRNAPRITMDDEKLVIEVEPGKLRERDPLIQTNRGIQHLSELAPGMVGNYGERKPYVAGQYNATLDLRLFGLSRGEVAEMRKGLGHVAANWADALRRPVMSREQLARRFAKAGEEARRRGAIPVSALSQAA